MVAAAVRAAARFNVRPLLPGPEDALRDTVVRLGVPAQRLPVLAEHAVLEALALEGLAPDLHELLQRLVRQGGGEVLGSAEGTRAAMPGVAHAGLSQTAELVHMVAGGVVAGTSDPAMEEVRNLTAVAWALVCAARVRRT